MAGWNDLPAELRLKIYKNLPIVAIADTENPVRASSQLLQTSKLIYNEALPVLHGDNTLLFQSSAEALIKLQIIREQARSYINDVLLRDADKLAVRGPPLLRWLPKLERFQIYDDINWRVNVTLIVPQKDWHSVHVKGALHPYGQSLPGKGKNDTRCPRRPVAIPVVDFLRYKAKNFPNLECGLIRAMPLMLQTGQTNSHGTMIRWDFVSDGAPLSRRTFATVRDIAFEDEEHIERYHDWRKECNAEQAFSQSLHAPPFQWTHPSRKDVTRKSYAVKKALLAAEASELEKISASRKITTRSKKVVTGEKET